MNIDSTSFFLWCITLTGIGIIFVPLTSLVLKGFFDKGYLFSKVLGLMMISFIVYILGIFHILPFTQWGISLVTVLCAVINAAIVIKKKIRLSKNTVRIMLLEELFFVCMIFLWTNVRSFQPDIHGLEKYMDFGFVNSILRTTYFPPKDMWYAPLPINYYYFGHLTTAVITKLTSIPSNISYNFMLATLFAFAISLGFSLASNLFFLFSLDAKQKVKAFITPLMFSGALGGVLLALGGNLHTIYAFFAPYQGESPVPFWQLQFLPFSFPNSYWYPNATRFIYHTIHEFPLYSFVVSDLHGHVLDIPNVLFAIAVMITLIFTMKAKTTIRMIVPHLILLGFVFSIMYMTNAWDSIIYFVLWTFLLVFAAEQMTVKKFFILLAIPFVTFFILTRPFSHFFDVSELVSGVGVLCAPSSLTNIGRFGPLLFEPEHCQHSPLYQLLILWGFPLLVFGLFGWFSLRYFKNKKPATADLITLTLFLFGFLLILIPEFVYLKDIYPQHYRANTMFKLVYQSFILFGIADAFAIARMLTAYSRKRAILTSILLFPFFLLVIIYPYFAVPSYYGLAVQKNIDGTAYLQTLYPSDYNAINWLNANVTGQPVILEAQGDSYTDYGRVSVNTGLPTVLGWTVHEWLWRGSYDPLPPRMNDIQNMYESPDINLTESLLKKYDVQLIFVGNLERTKYTHLNLEKLNQIGKVIYSQGTTTIYKVN